jgi:membrane-associated phospholipid phosphatase
MLAAGAIALAVLSAFPADAPGALDPGLDPGRVGASRPLRFDVGLDAPLTAAGAVLALGLSLAQPALAPARCRWCRPDPLDEDAREALLWARPARAARASDLLANAVLPAGAAAAVLAPAWAAHDGRQAAEDAVAIGEAVLLAVDAELAVKDLAARSRPSAFYTGGGGRQANLSFFSGHTSFAFSLATATATVATLRGEPAAPWLWAGGMSLAAGVGYLRVAGDAHWLTDVVAGAAVGGAIGFAVPWLLHGWTGARRIIPAPDGVAVVL